MAILRTLALLAVMAVSAMAQAAVEDPVMQVKARRAAQVGDGDLPPVPRAVLEPPPLPPPEAYERKGRSAAKSSRVTKASGRKAKATAAKGRPKTSAKAEGGNAPARKAVKRSTKRK